jgi:inosose dehydratase
MTPASPLRIGNCPDSWGVWFPDNPNQIPWERFLDEVVEAGFEWIETGPIGYLPTKPEILLPEIERRGLKVAATFLMTHMEDDDALDHIEAQMALAAPLLRALKIAFVVLIDGTYINLETGEPDRPRRLNEDGWNALIENTNTACDLLSNQYGVTPVFHPHTDTHVEYDDQMEAFLAETDPSVQMVLDTGHHAFRGGDPVSFMRKHYRRIPYLHVKNVDPTVTKEVEEKGLGMVDAVAMGAFVEPGEGIVDFKALLGTLHDVGYTGIVMVEQDMYPVPFDKPLPIAKRTRRYLKDLGYG